MQTASLIQCSVNKDVVEYISKERNLTLDIAIKSTHIEDLVRSVGEKDVLKAITGAILMASEYFNVKGEISDSQAVQTASLFMEQFPMETFEDLLICLKNAKIGKYGPVYNRFDGQMVFTWFRLYLDEKYERFEQIKKLEQEQWQAETMQSFAPILSKLFSQLDSDNEKAKAEEKIRSKRVSAEKHFKQFKDIVPEFTEEELREYIKYYRKQNDLSIGNQFQHYIDLLESTLNQK